MLGSGCPLPTHSMVNGSPSMTLMTATLGRICTPIDGVTTTFEAAVAVPTLFTASHLHVVVERGIFGNNARVASLVIVGGRVDDEHGANGLEALARRRDPGERRDGDARARASQSDRLAQLDGQLLGRHRDGRRVL